MKALNNKIVMSSKPFKKLWTVLFNFFFIYMSFVSIYTILKLPLLVIHLLTKIHLPSKVLLYQDLIILSGSFLITLLLSKRISNHHANKGELYIKKFEIPFYIFSVGLYGVYCLGMINHYQ